ncbi:TFIIE alpha subunit family protein [Aphelenchoides avenae]|nr:TFIIE alpha subunit family protein [Aphelenchus avenae]
MATDIARGADGVDKNNIVSEIPETLKRLTLMLTKAFYGPEHYLVVDYVQRSTIIREERLREMLRVETRYLRQLLQPLKVDKFVKERIVAEEVEGRQRKVAYLFVNYKSLLNVTKYKIDHMRQKLEVREKDDVHKASYRCSGENCGMHYDAMDIGKIYDPFTQEMRCWQCTNVVLPDEQAGPTEETRSSLAKFNEQMAGIFTILRNLDGIRFARHILEPPISSVAESSDQGETRKVLQVGERAFSTAGRTRTDLYSSGITVSIGEGVSASTEAKPVVPWLQDRAPAAEAASSNMLLEEHNLVDNLPSLANPQSTAAAVQYDAEVPTLSAMETVDDTSQPADFMPKRDDISSLLDMESDISAADASSQPPASEIDPAPEREQVVGETAPSDDETHDADYIVVGGARVHINDVTDEMVQVMTAEEKEAYIRMMSNEEDEFY